MDSSRRSSSAASKRSSASGDAACRITTALVRLVPLGALMQEARQSLAITKPAAPRTSAGPDSRKPDRDYHEVANVYFRAWVRGEAPLEVIAEKYTVSHSTAARWVRVARKRGILSPAEHGRAGGYPRWIDPAEDVSDPDYKWSDFQKEGE